MIWTIIIYAGFTGITVLVGGLLAKAFNHHLKDSPIIIAYESENQKTTY